MNRIKKNVKDKIEMMKLINKIGTRESVMIDLTKIMTVTIEMIIMIEKLVIMIVIVMAAVEIEENNMKRRITLLIQILTLESFILMTHNFIKWL